MPKAESVDRESKHEVRRNMMLEVFSKATRKKFNNKGEKGMNKKIESNLSKLEQDGLKSLQKRVNNNEIIVTETDKSRRFCVLTVTQYRIWQETYQQ